VADHIPTLRSVEEPNVSFAGSIARPLATSRNSDFASNNRYEDTRTPVSASGIQYAHNKPYAKTNKRDEWPLTNERHPDWRRH
jgi:hypothetical protein